MKIPKNEIEQKCKEINEQLLAGLDTARAIPLEVSSFTMYNMTVGPIEMGFQEEYMTGEFDNILRKYHTEVFEKFDNKMIELGLRPSMSFEDFMGEEFAEEPKVLMQELEESIKYRADELKRLSENEMEMPEEMLEALLEDRQESLAQAVLAYNKEQYAVTQSEIDYHRAWHEKFHEYQSLFKD
jgi:membrane protease subunit (stomatin/prohibitin family)